MSGLRFLRFDDPHAYLEATKDYDDSFMNFGIGSLRDFLSGIPTRQVSDIPTYIFAMYQGEDLRITLSVNKQDFAWMMSTPCPADERLAMDPELLAAATTLLATSVLAALPDPLVFDKIIGPLKPVEAFINTWIALLRAQGRKAKILLGEFDHSSRISYATRASLPPPLATPPPYRVEPATHAGLRAAAALWQHFQATSPWRGIFSIEEAIGTLTGPADAGLVWVCRLEAEPDGHPAAFAVLGRVTPRTIAIRNVYVSPEHRRKGVAETMVRAITRYFLGVAAPYGVHGVPDGPPACGFKEEVNLNVGDPSAEGVYRRSGFLLPTGTGEDMKGGVDPETGRRAWYPSIWRGVEVEPEPEAKA
ncbi:hypothetical protein LXA43DRAFT_1022307 [Ganoderma leucocontextum]|nr:hypothetical protein LXA43DRAFT_1022307 [Ganoderma leucocontextum]